MSGFKLGSAAAVLAACGMSMALTGCSVSEDILDFALNDNHESLRAPTGYYEHADAVAHPDRLKVSEGLDPSVADKTYDFPVMTFGKTSEGLVGANMDVRPPVVNQVGTDGVSIVNVNDSAAVWFPQEGKYAVPSKDHAWNHLNAVLNYLKIGIAKSDPVAYSIVTKNGYYSSDGAPYDDYALDMDMLRYEQTYEISVISDSSGRVGYQITLKTSETLDPFYESVRFTTDVLTTVQKRNFTAGLGNTLIRGMVQQSAPQETLPDTINVLLSRDNNNQDAFIIRAPYRPSWKVLHGLFSDRKYGFKVIKYSIAGSNFHVQFDPDDDTGSLAALEKGEYIVRVGVGAGNSTTVTVFDEDDQPVKTDILASIYPALANMIAAEYALYKADPANYVAKLREE